MAVVEGGEHAGGDLQGSLGQDLAALADDVAQGPPGDVLHHDVGLGDVAAVGRHLLAGVVDRHDRGVVERGGRLGLATEPGLEGGVAGEVGAQPLDGDGPAEPHVGALADLGHAAAPEELAHLVASADPVRFRHRRLSLPSGARCSGGARRCRAGLVCRGRGSSVAGPCRCPGPARCPRPLPFPSPAPAVGRLGLLVGREAPSSWPAWAPWLSGLSPSGFGASPQTSRVIVAPFGDLPGGIEVGDGAGLVVAGVVDLVSVRRLQALVGQGASTSLDRLADVVVALDARRSPAPGVRLVVGGVVGPRGVAISRAAERRPRTTAAAAYSGQRELGRRRRPRGRSPPRRLVDVAPASAAAPGPWRPSPGSASAGGGGTTAAAPSSAGASRRAAASCGAVGVAGGGVLGQARGVPRPPGRRARGRAAAARPRGCGPAPSRSGCRATKGRCPLRHSKSTTPSA